MKPILGDLPDHIKVVRDERLSLKQAKDKEKEEDLKLLSKSENPEIQALCRVLGLDVKRRI